MKFDPKDKHMVNKTIRMDAELVKTIYDVAGKRNLSFNKFVVQCVEYAMKNLEQGGQEH